MKTIISGYFIWAVVGYIIAVIRYRTIPQMKAMNADKKAKQQRQKNYPQARIIKSQFNNN